MSEVLPTRAVRLSRASMRARTASRNCGFSLSRSAIAVNPDDNAPGFFGGTRMPVSPTISFESPTSVTTHGTPHAIASAIALDVPSPYDDEEQQMSKAL